MSEILVADIETNAIYMPSVIWMVGVLNYETDEFRAYVGDEVPEALVRMAEADMLIGHNFLDYDIFHIERLTESLITYDRQKIVDTLPLSRKLYPKLENHKLSTWGDIFGYPKLDFKKFDRFDPEMIPYCERDVRLNKRLFDHLLAQMNEDK